MAWCCLSADLSDLWPRGRGGVISSVNTRELLNTSKCKQHLLSPPKKSALWSVPQTSSVLPVHYDFFYGIIKKVWFYISLIQLSSFGQFYFQCSFHYLFLFHYIPTFFLLCFIVISIIMLMNMITMIVWASISKVWNILLSFSFNQK